MIYTDVIQGTDEWKKLRAGRFTASRIADVMAKTKSGYSASRKNYLAELLVERMTGEPSPHFTNAAMQWGTEKEPEARIIYELKTGHNVDEVGLILPDEMQYTAGSPDGLIGDDGGIEIKCPNTATHIETLINKSVPKKYYAQIQWNLFCSGRQWWDFVSYDPRMNNDRLSIYIERVERDQEFIASCVVEVEKAESELCGMIKEMEALLHDND